MLSQQLPVGLIFDEGMTLHAPPPSSKGMVEHIERPERVAIVWQALEKANLVSKCCRILGRPPTFLYYVPLHTHAARSCRP